MKTLSISLLLLSSCGLNVKLNNATINEVYIWSESSCPKVCDLVYSEWTGYVQVEQENINCICDY